MTLIFCVLLTNGFGQVWIDSNAKWTFDYYNILEHGTWRWEYTNDTIIQGHKCQSIKGTKYRHAGPSGSIIHYGDTYTYTSKDSVFYYNGDRFFLLYDFGAQIGDTWIVAIDNSIEVCRDTAIVQVVDTGTILINGNVYRTITLETISESLFALNGLCVERFGLRPTANSDTNFGFLPGIRHCEGGPFLEPDGLVFRCYEDSSFPTYNPTNKDCDTLTTTSELMVENFRIYPNPSNGTLTIDSPSNKVNHVEIIDLYGRVIANQPYSDEVDVSKLHNGIYLIKMKFDNKKEIIKTFIKQ